MAISEKTTLLELIQHAADQMVAGATGTVNLVGEVRGNSVEFDVTLRRFNGKPLRQQLTVIRKRLH